MCGQEQKERDSSSMVDAYCRTPAFSNFNRTVTKRLGQKGAEQKNNRIHFSAFNKSMVQLLDSAKRNDISFVSVSHGMWRGVETRRSL
jgi:hypothetical protein